MNIIWPSRKQKELKDIQTQINFVDGQILQTKNLIHQLNSVLKNHEINKARLEAEADKVRKRKEP